jgi:hypothetical protein
MNILESNGKKKKINQTIIVKPVYINQLKNC